MHSHEALQRAINGKTIEHAKHLGLSSSLINKWQEPHVDFEDSGAYNPLDRIETIVQTSLNLGIAREEAHAPIYYLAHRFNLACIMLPYGTREGCVNEQIIRSIKEFADLAQATSEALADGRISKIEAKKIEREGQEALRAISSLLAIVKESIR